MSDKLPNYILDIDENDPESGLKAIAYTNEPAILKKGVYLKDIKPLSFVDNLLYQVAAPAIIPMSIYRASDDLGEYTVEFTADEILKMVKDFQKQQRPFNLEHNGNQIAPSYILYSWIIEDPKTDLSFTKYGIDGLKKGTWFVVSQFTDQDYFMKEIVDKGRFGYSVEGFFDLKRDFSKMKKVNFSELPPLHNNCECEIVDGEWILGEKPCQMCMDAADAYNSMSKFTNISTDDGEFFLDGDLKVGISVKKITSNGKSEVENGTRFRTKDGILVEVNKGVIVQISKPADGKTDKKNKKQDMTYNFKNISTKDGNYYVDGDPKVGARIMEVDSNLDKKEIADGSYVHLEDGTVYEIHNGTIAEISTDKEEQEDGEMGEDGKPIKKGIDKTQPAIDEPEQLDEETMDVVNTDPMTPEVKSDLVDPASSSLTIEDVINHIQPMLDDITKKIAELQTAMEQDSIEDAPEKMGKLEQKMSIGDNISKLLRNK
jgi:hypothetical protein